MSDVSLHHPCLVLAAYFRKCSLEKYLELTALLLISSVALPSGGDPVGNPAYPVYTVATGGVNWINVATTLYNYSLVLAYNYPYSGATINASLVAPVPPINRSPLMFAQPPSSQALEKSVISDFNSKLASHVASRSSNYSDVQTFLWDSKVYSP
ncbi:hypothetical protein FISHEDRAFT_73447 [Fistulina hepatica ATCC 64428]|uniref:Uncharacterized protein n=1 Tax=Fistulina hepatica ATCC 64428 TaxID=1128425 RepID=A0A0D7AFF0_9AGAR|nr:hypothetical protein FISHEDRAFT_73447 [Fistulina hepatica ATCC 64428]